MYLWWSFLLLFLSLWTSQHRTAIFSRPNYRLPGLYIMKIFSYINNIFISLFRTGLWNMIKRNLLPQDMKSMRQTYIYHVRSCLLLFSCKFASTQESRTASYFSCLFFLPVSCIKLLAHEWTLLVSFSSKIYCFIFLC